MDKGSLCQLRNLIDRRNVSVNSENDYNTCDDFLVQVIECHIIASGMELLKMDSTTSQPLLTEDLWLKDDDHRRDVLHAVSKEIVMKYVDLSTSEQSNTTDLGDKVLTYACDLLSYDLLYLDSIREGDGLTIIRCWKYLMLVIKVAEITP